MKMFAALVLFFALAPPLRAIGLAWDSNPTIDQVTKYSVYQASVLAGPFAKISDVLPTACSATTCTYSLGMLTPGVYYFRVTASNVWAESAPSNVVSTPGPASVPKNLIIVASVAEDGTVTIKLITIEEFLAMAR